MKLLLDQNLSRRIIPLLQEKYPGSTQVALIRIEHATDQEIWQYAKQNDFVIVTQDSDFHEMSLLFGSPPKIIWLKLGNQKRHMVIEILLNIEIVISESLNDKDVFFIEVY